MQKGWSILFGVVLLATFLIWFVAPFFNWWLPENVSADGGEADLLFYVILGFTTFFFILTEAVLVYAMWEFAHKEGQKATYTHGNHRLEMLWTAVPAALLLFIAFTQINTWAKMKYASRQSSPDLTVSVLARQWEWRMRYTADQERFQYDTDGAEVKAQKERIGRAWAENPEIDDVQLANELHVWKGAHVKLYLRTMDVLHSFTLPNMRRKQDTLPGRTLPMWFQPTKANCRWDDGQKRMIELGGSRDAWEIACQEHCGARHYAMRGRVYVHENRASYDQWLAHAQAQQKATEPETAGASAN